MTRKENIGAARYLRESYRRTADGWRFTERAFEIRYLEAYRADALFDAHTDDPEFGYRFLVDEARYAAASMADGSRGGSAQTTAGGRRSGRRRHAARA